MINRVILVGRLTKDPELSYTPSGIPKTRFTVAVNRFKKEGEEQQADFISCIAWRKQAENLANFMKKGSLIGVEGRIQTSSFEGQDGKRVYTTDVVADHIQFLERNNTQQSQPQSNQQTQQYSQPQQQQPWGQQTNNQQQNYTRVDEDPFASSRGPVNVSEDDLPF
ncbi:single-stranded DNA-binding protein [Ureibacillus sinduriensis]|uniref:Single-stranded DNA-binding protein n=1 Tax=Ureibacillus sinduriensis BLB-1 = JCM 15800 TaxID=1384057 RepID=A0A0A3HUJ9_9BACL|nr:single-stranded DNA-binding protein [Ureibacillus sinduriensis]KGR74875.1 single-stranded DNA-binding protein [Ureibacillus sinduriensis BLB-1 = JCM 15800]